MRKYTTEDYITRARAKHGDRYDYTRLVYGSAHDCVEIGCPDHGWFIQKACAHLLYGCNKCGDVHGTRKRTTNYSEFIARAHRKHDFRYDYSHVQFTNQHDLVEIICPMHGSFRQAANDHLKGHGCILCAVERRSIKRRDIPGYDTDEFIRKAIAKHGDRYDYDKTVYLGSLHYVTIMCRTHGEFTQAAHNHLQGYGCLKCGNTNKSRGPRRRTGPVLLAEFVERAQAVHGDRYDYQYYSTLTAKVGVVCPDHGLFMQTGTDHLAAAGCPWCARTAKSEKQRYSKSEFETMLSERWEDRITLANDYHDLDTKTTFVCLAHGEFAATPESVLASKHGCPACWAAVRGLAIKLTQEEYEQRACKVHHNKYQYGNYHGKANKIDIECPVHGVFSQNAGNHIAGNGCPRCGVHKTQSQNAWLDRLGITEREVWLTIAGSRIKADGFDRTTKTVYEFWGDFWHGNPKLYHPDDINTATGVRYGDLYDRTIRKRRLITENGYNLIEIWEHDWGKINGR